MTRSGKKKTTRRKRARVPRGRRFWKMIAGAAALAIVAMAGYWGYERFLANGSPKPAAEVGTGVASSGGGDSRAGTGSMSVKIFFGNSDLDPMGIDCSRVFPVERRIPATEAVARAALDALLAGPSSDEAAHGFFTSLGEGIEIRSVELEDGVARVDFGPKLGQELAGSCRVESARSQIRSTLEQFPTIRSVVITGEGSGEFPLQP